MMSEWEKTARQLAAALTLHRADMHQISDRPCSTCALSSEALRRYERLCTIKERNEQAKA